MAPKHSFRALFLLTMCAASLWAGREFTAGNADEVADDELIIHLKPGANAAAILAAAGGGSQLIAQHELNLLVRTPHGQAPTASNGLAGHALVDYVEPNRIRRRQASLPALNDPNASSQWALTTVKAIAAWNVIPDRFFTSTTTGSGRIRVAILDTGTDCTHPDFKNSGGSSVDSAQGGQLNMTLSQAFVATTKSNPACAWQDDYGHGTHVAGTVAAATQNALGVAALGYPIELVTYKVMDSNGSGTDFTISQAIRAAADAGIHFVSMSLGGAGYSQTFQSAINYAWERNTLVIAAAGNNNINTLFFPAAANYAIGVAATDSNNSKASFSNWGIYNVDIAAPGVNVLSTMPTYGNPFGVQNYGYLSGTSMATPHVTALAGLIALTTPGYSVAAIAQRIQQSASSSFVNGGWDQYQGYGIIDALRAVSGNLRTATVGGIVGQVVDPSAFPIGGAQVAAGGQTFTTDTDGLFRLQNLAAGSYNLQVSASGYQVRNITIVVRGGADTTATVPMGVFTGNFTGTVTSGGVGLGGAIVQALASGLIKGTAVSDSNGVYVLPALPGTYDIQVSGISRVSTTATSKTVSSGGTTTVNIALPPEGTIAGTVRDTNSAPISNAQVTFIQGALTAAGTVTDGSGNYSSIGLAAGTYSVLVSATGFPDSTTNNVVVTAGAVTTINVQMGGAAAVTARGTTGYATGNVIQNTSFGPLSGSNGPFTIAFWFRSGGINPTPSYLVDAEGSTAQWAVLYGYQSNQIEFYSGDPFVRPGTGITINDTNWHHVAYRKSGPGAAAWDKFLDGVKTPINASLNFTLGTMTKFYAFNIENLAPCNCAMSDIVIYDTARPDSELANLAAGNHPAASPVPVLYWPLSGSGSTEADASGNGHPGTVLGAVNPVPGPPFSALPVTAAPVFAPPTGIYAPGQQVTITTTTAGASITYTIDGSTPAPGFGTQYSGPITVNATTTIKAIAYKSGNANSSVTSATYTISAGGTGARGTSGYASGNAIQNTTFGPLSGSNGPFTIEFWFRSGGLNPIPSYVLDAELPGQSQWAVIYGYASNQLEFFTGNAAVRTGTGITIVDTNWHHIAYRKSASGASAWDKFLDGVKTPINASINFSLGTMTQFYAFNIENLAPCNCSMSDVVIYDTARPDVEIANLAAGTHPGSSPIPVLYWPLSGSGSVENDLSGNGHPGTVLGAVNAVAGPNYSGTPLAAAPVFTPGAGTYAPGQQVTITTTTSGASIRYTTNGSTPTSTLGTLYGGPITLSATTTLKAIAYAAGFTDSSVTSALYTINTGATGARGTSGYASGNAIQNTSFGPLSGSNGPFTIAFWFRSSALNPNPSYVLDAESPGQSQWSVIYGYASNQLEFFTGNASVRTGTGITIADTNWHHVAYRKSAAGASAWDKFLDGVKTPINASINFSLGAMTQFYAFNIENLAPCNCSMSDIVIYDTARPDQEIANLAAGTHPAASPIPVLYWPLSGSGSVENDSSGNGHPGTVLGAVNPVAGPNYSGTPLAAAPVFAPGAGTYAPGQQVTITSATPGASIRYTTDGSTPTSSFGTPYGGPVTLNTTTTLKAIAYAAGFTDSSVTSALYTISSASSGARGVSGYASGNVIQNTSFGPLSGSNGPFTIAFWFRSGGLNPNPSYVLDAESPGQSQWAVIYGYTSNQIEFYTGNAAVRAGTGIAINDTNWHHIAYRKSGAGASAWDKFVDGVKTPINASINFTFGAMTQFYAFNIENLAPANCSLMDIVIYDTARPDSEIANLAAHNHPAASPVPVLSWPLSGTGSLEADASGNNHPGTVLGSVNPVAGPF